MLLEGKKLLVTGVLTRESIAYASAKALQERGAEIVLTSFGRAMGLTEKSARRLPSLRHRSPRAHQSWHSPSTCPAAGG
jgi:enoyl-[acyl-carrier-protein] reductase (NADH)